MATTKTTKIANAISLLSDVLSDEVAEGNHFLEDEDDSVSLEDFDDVKDSAANFVTDQINGLESIKHEIEDEIGTDGAFDAWDIEDDEDDEDEYEEDDVGNGTVVVEGESEDEADEAAEDAAPTDAEKIESLIVAGEELEDKMAELEAEKEVLKNALTSVLSGVDDLIDAAESYQTEIEAY